MVASRHVPCVGRLVIYAITMALAALPARAATAKVTVDGARVTAATDKVIAVFDGPGLVSLRPAGDDVEFMHPTRPAFPLDLVYANLATLGKDKHESVTARSLSDRAAVVVLKGEDGERTLLITTDEKTGDVCVTPSGIANRRSLLSVRWTAGLHPKASLVLPVVNGLRVEADKPWPGNARFAWPFQWNAQLIVAERGAYACMIHSEDTTMTFKALNFVRQNDRRELGLETELPGPIWEQRTAGGLTWRLSAYRGDWRIPAARYRDWMARAYDLAAKRAGRPAWVDRITLAACWAGPNTEILDALAAIHPPEQTLIHLSDWRTDKYDVNYPEYTPRPETIEYIGKAKKMGFHVMPHFNYFSVYYKHPFYQEVRDFQVRDVRSNEPQGWHWPPETHDYTRMAFIHPGLSLWRGKLIDTLLGACNRLGTDVAFIDQTLCTWNTDNGLVEGMNTVGGMQRLQEEFAAIRPDLVLAGEGLNEMSFQRQCFAQAHIHDGWTAVEQKQVDATVPICAFLWAGHTRLIGYYHLNPDDKAFDLTAELYRRMGTVPTIITNNPTHLRQMSDGMKRIFEAAGGIRRSTTQPADSKP